MTLIDSLCAHENPVVAYRARRLLWRKGDHALIVPEWGGPIDKIHYPIRFCDVRRSSMADPIPPEKRVRGFFLGLFLGGISSFFVGYIQWAVTARGEDSELGLIGVCAMGAFGAFSGGFVGTLFSGRSSANRPKRRLALAAVLAPILFFGAMLFVYRGFMYPSDTLPAALFWVVASAAIGALVSWVVSPAGRKPTSQS